MNNNEQRGLPLIGEIAGPKDLSAELIQSCESKEDAVRLCWVMRRDKSMTITKAAERMGISRPQLSKLIDGSSGWRGNQERAFQFLVGNRAIAQFQAFELGCVLVDEKWEDKQKNSRKAA